MWCIKWISKGKRKKILSSSKQNNTIQIKYKQDNEKKSKLNYLIIISYLK